MIYKDEKLKILMLQILIELSLIVDDNDIEGVISLVEDLKKEYKKRIKIYIYIYI